LIDDLLVIHREIKDLRSKITNDSNDQEIPESKIGRSGIATGRVLAVATELDLVTSLLAVIAAVLAVRSLRFDGAIAGRVSTFRRSSHVTLRSIGLYASSCWRTRRGGMLMSWGYVRRRYRRDGANAVATHLAR
jgi:hypothetical protein